MNFFFIYFNIKHVNFIIIFNYISLVVDKKRSINEFIRSHGEGFHHICFEVEDLESTMEEWKSKGVTFSVEPPRYGSRGGYITFTDRETTGGLAIELIEYKKND